MSESKLNIVFLGLTITSTWGNGHATTYRGLVKSLSRLGHHVTFLECDKPWYASNREFTQSEHATIRLYSGLDELRSSYSEAVRTADLVVVGSYVPDGIAVGDWALSTRQGVCAFYDIDTPVTLVAVKNGGCEYLARPQIAQYDLYLSFTGGPVLKLLERDFGSSCARALYCSVDPELYFPLPDTKIEYDIAYLGTYAEDRQQSLEKLLLKTAQSFPQRHFAVAGPQYPSGIMWPDNVKRIEHLPANEHRGFYNSQRFTLNLTRRNMVQAGFSPSVRLFEAAACGTPFLSDPWPGLECFFNPSRDLIVVRSTSDVENALAIPEERRREIGKSAKRRALKFHTSDVRARELLSHLESARTVRAQKLQRSRAPLPRREAVVTFS